LNVVATPELRGAIESGKRFRVSRFRRQLAGVERDWRELLDALRSS